MQKGVSFQTTACHYDKAVYFYKYLKGGFMKIEITIYDNLDKSFDRYTVVIKINKVTLFFGMSENALGFNQFLGTDRDGYKKGSHLGTKVPFSSVSPMLKKAIWARVEQ
jgi:hypothetical protein